MRTSVATLLTAAALTLSAMSAGYAQDATETPVTENCAPAGELDGAATEGTDATAVDAGTATATDCCVTEGADAEACPTNEANPSGTGDQETGSIVDDEEDDNASSSDGSGSSKSE